MLNTYIKNRGHTQTLIRNNNKNKFNEINWDADYDGKVANISVTSEIEGNKKQFDIKLDNNDLAELLNVSSVNVPIHKRLQNDFDGRVFIHEPRVYQIELPVAIKRPENDMPEPSPISYIDSPKTDSVEELLETIKPTSFLSSPNSNEEFIVPLTIDEKPHNSFVFTPRKRHFRKKTHRTYKIYKKRKTPTSSRKKTLRRSSSKN
jgi:hypothetical protein